MENKSENIQETNLQEINNKQQNPFVETIKNLLISYQNEGKIETILENINEKLKSNSSEHNEILNIEEFIILGGMSYFVGLDFCQQTVLKESIVNKFIERFSQFNFNENTLNLFQKIIKNDLIIDKCEKAKDLLKETIFDNVNLTLLENNNIRIIINTILKNSIFPVIYSVSINDIINTKKYTYHDIISINDVLQKIIDVKGTQFNNLAKLYSDKTFVKLLEESTKRFNDSKFAIVYFDSIISTVEVQKRFNHLNIIDFFDLEYFNNFGDFAEETKDVKEIENSEEKIKKENEMNILQNNHPEKFIAGVLKDVYGKEFTNPLQIIEAIETASQNNDYVQHIYHYMKAKQNDKTNEPLTEIFNLNESQIEEFKNLLTDKISELRGQTKALTEILLKELPKEKLDIIINYINNIIESLVISGIENKGYLLTQYTQNGISTYQHLQQILSIIEIQKIDGSKINNYIVFYDYIENQTDCKTVFENTSKLDSMYTSLSFYQQLKQFYF